LNDWAGSFNDLIRSNPAQEYLIGVAMPGPFDYKEGISLMKEDHKFGALYGINIKNMLAEKLNVSPAAIQFRNDAEAFLEGELFCGAARGYKNAVALTLGTGLGSAYSQNGVSSDADLWKSSFLDGMAEEYLSTRWFINRYRQLTNKEIHNVKMLADMTHFNHHARQVFYEFGINLSLFINKMMIGFKPQIIVLGGNISKAYLLYETAMLSGLLRTDAGKIQLSKLGELAALVGGACIWENQFD
jgi:glucokinase